MFKQRFLGFMPMLDADPPAKGGGNEPPAGGTPPAGGQPATPEIDYDKIASLIQGKQTVAEEQVLKGYFKQQGLSQEQMTEAIAAYKKDQASKTPDVQALQTEAETAKAQALRESIRSQALMMSDELGISLKTMPYVLKLADMKDVVKDDGTVDSEKLKAAINKVIEDVPALKPSADDSQSGFKVGADGGGDKNAPNEAALMAAFNVKK